MWWLCKKLIVELVLLEVLKNCQKTWCYILYKAIPNSSSRFQPFQKYKDPAYHKLPQASTTWTPTDVKSTQQSEVMHLLVMGWFCWGLLVREACLSCWVLVCVDWVGWVTLRACFLNIYVYVILHFHIFIFCIKRCRSF